MATSSTSSLFFGNRELAATTTNNNNNIQPPPPPQLQPHHHPNQHSLAVAPPSSSPAPPPKKKRNLPGGPSKYPDAEVIALSPKTLMATNRFICEVCNKGFQREQNLQLHRRGHNLPWKLKQKNPKDPVRKKVYLCPETSCVHHDASRALGDLTGIKKHFSRKHGEKKFKCEKCSKRYAVQSDWKAHSKTCGTREYRCDCGTLFSRRDSFITHRAFCDALAQESARLPTSLTALGTHMFGSSSGGGAGVGNNMGLGMGMGMGLSHQALAASHLPCFSDQQMMTSESLGLGGGVRQFDHLLGTSFRPHQQQNNNFYLSNHHEQNPVRYENSSQDQNQGQLNQFSDHQGNNNGMHPFNLGFFSGNNNNNNDTNTINSGSTGSGDHSSGLFSPEGGLFGGPTQGYNTGQVSLQQQNQSSMSATALLQKASQMGSTNSTPTATTTAAINGFQPNKPPSPPTSGGGGFGGLFFGENDQNTLNDFLLSKDTSSIYDIGGNINHSQPSNGLNNKYNRFNPNTKPGQGGLGSSDSLTRDFLGVGQIMRSVSGAGFTTTTRSEQHQVDGTSMANFNNNNNNNNQINNSNNNNPNNNNNNNVNYSGATSNQSYGGGNSF